MQERREYHRMKVSVPMSFCIPPDFSRCLSTTLDIGGTGLSFTTAVAPQPRQELLLYLMLPGEEKVEVHARVIRTERISPQRFKVGVRIVDPIKFDEKKFVKFYAGQLKELFSKQKDQ